jgi:hypothetical protein
MQQLLAVICHGAQISVAWCMHLSAQTMLADMDTLAWADYTVGTMWSNFDAVAFYVAVCSYGRQQSTYVDGSRNPFGPYA